VTGGGRSLPALAKQAAIAVRQMAEGEEAMPGRDITTWMALVYLLAGLFVIEILLGVAFFVINAFL
jgi:hypothetical protein